MIDPCPDWTPKRAETRLRKFRFGAFPGASRALRRHCGGDKTAVGRHARPRLRRIAAHAACSLRGKPLTLSGQRSRCCSKDRVDRRLRVHQPHASRPPGSTPRRRPAPRHFGQVARRASKSGSKSLSSSNCPASRCYRFTIETMASTPLDVAGWRNAAHELADAPGGFWSFSGATHEDRRDWVQPLSAGLRAAQHAGHGRVGLRRRHSDGQHLAPRRGPGRGSRGNRASPARPARSQDGQGREHRHRDACRR